MEKNKKCGSERKRKKGMVGRGKKGEGDEGIRACKGEKPEKIKEVRVGNYRKREDIVVCGWEGGEKQIVVYVLKF